jgi:hypothetical protein
MSTYVDLTDMVFTVILGVVGAFLVHRYSRQMRTQLAEARRSAYAELWEITGLAAPSLLDRHGPAGALTEPERRRLYDALTRWYYQNGNGLVLERTSSKMFLNARHNLTCDVHDLCPPSDCNPSGEQVPLLDLMSANLTEEQRRGCLSMRQLSLLRTQLKLDLAVFGPPAAKGLHDHERAFLVKCGARIERARWELVLEKLQLRDPNPWAESATADVKASGIDWCGDTGRSKKPFD